MTLLTSMRARVVVASMCIGFASPSPAYAQEGDDDVVLDRLHHPQGTITGPAGIAHVERRGDGPVPLLLIAGVPTCTTSDLSLESLIAAKAAELSGTEHCQFRLYDSLSDLDGDKLSDLVVVFTVEQGGRGQKDVQFMGVFLSTAPTRPRVVEVGRTREALVVRVDVWPPDIALQAMEYRPTDALCCPTLSAGRTYRLSADGLTLTYKWRNKQFRAEPPEEPTEQPRP